MSRSTNDKSASLVVRSDQETIELNNGGEKRESKKKLKFECDYYVRFSSLKYNYLSSRKL